jgi:hypothetical protein
MLKFKEIRNSIVNRKGKAAIAKNEGTERSPISGQGQFWGERRSPIRVNGCQEQRQGEQFMYETNRKGSMPVYHNPFQSDTKENAPKNHYQPITFSNLSDNKLQFTHHPRRPVNTAPTSNIYTDAAPSTPKKSNLSFASLLQSKKSGHKGICTERQDERESSISKLKEKLFGLKRVISDKDKEEMPVTPKKVKEQQTAREPMRSPFDSIPFDDLVKMSLKEQ